MERHAREVLRLAPRDVDSHGLLGIALASQGNVDEAIDLFRAALEINPSSVQARENLARALRLSSSGRSGAAAGER
jgi:Flp pilus assembly protein TadD